MILPKSNCQGNGPVPVGSTGSLNRFGILDMVGNVREWAFNACYKAGSRLIKGGGWNDFMYSADAQMVLDSWDRSPSNGFRCVKYREYRPEIRKLEAWTLQQRKLKHQERQPVSKEVFEFYLNQFAYDKTDLEAVVDSVIEAEHWIKEKIHFNATYGNERMIAYLFLPKRGRPPFQTVIYYTHCPH